MKTKKSLLFSIILLTLLLNVLSTQIIKAEDLPSGIVPKIPVVGQINEETGLPSSFEKFKAASDNLSSEESRKQYLYREWTKIKANSSLAAVFFYTDEAFSLLNPLWKFAFDMEFKWSWEFIFCFVIFIVLIFMIAMPLGELTNFNKILAFAMSFIITLLVGKSGVIKKAADELTFMVKNIWLALFALILAVLFTLIYSWFMTKLGKDVKKQAEEEELKQANRIIKLNRKISEGELNS